MQHLAVFRTLFASCTHQFSALPSVQTFFIAWLLLTYKKKGGTVVLDIGGRRYLLQPADGGDEMEAPCATGLSHFRSYLDQSSTIHIVDCDGAGQIQPSSHSARTFVISSPDPAHYSTWKTQQEAPVFVMPVWSEDECKAVVPHVFSARRTPDGLDVYQERFKLYGGIARTVFSSDSSEELYKDLLATIRGSKLRETIQSVDNPVKQAGASHKLLHLKVDEANFRQSSVVLVFASERVSELVLAAQEAQHVSDTIDFLGQAVNSPHLAGIRGTIFEWHAHAVLAKGGKFRTRLLKESVEKSKWATFERRQLIVAQDLTNIGNVSPTLTTTHQLRQRRVLMNVSVCLCVCRAMPACAIPVTRLLTLRPSPSTCSR